MAKIISKCPSCGGELKIALLKCNECGMELKNDFELSNFDLLNQTDNEFLMSFLKNRGNMSALQDELDISYPTAKKRLDDLLIALGITENKQFAEETEVIDVMKWNTAKNSNKASDIIKNKLKESGGRVTVYTINNLPCEIVALSDGVSFASDKLPIKPPYTYEVFDVITELLIRHGGSAQKGNGRNYKLGEPKCDETTVVGTIGEYMGYQKGNSVYDPVFVLAAVMEWAGIATNGRGELVLTSEYKKLRQL